ncbi:hypothetical protein [Streptomyces plicatus]|uniref:Uncharacterized protein n=1 Tax=Streptomyces plicatus TaxID=1922 RepID=A0ABW1XZ28_STRPL
MATFSTVLSSTTVSWARLITARISQRWVALDGGLGPRRARFLLLSLFG